MTFGVITALAAALVLMPGAPLITILVVSQVVNAILLVPLLVFMVGVSRDRDLMGDYTAKRPALVAYLVTIVAVLVCILALAATTFL